MRLRAKQEDDVKRNLRQRTNLDEKKIDEIVASGQAQAVLQATISDDLADVIDSIQQRHASILALERSVEVVRLNDLDRHLVPLLDGKHDKAALVEKLTVIAQSGALNVQRDGLTLYDANEIQQALNAIIEQAIGNVARMALLVS